MALFSCVPHVLAKEAVSLFGTFEIPKKRIVPSWKA